MSVLDNIIARQAAEKKAKASASTGSTPKPYGMTPELTGLDTIFQTMFGASPAKQQPANKPAWQDWFAQVFGSTGEGKPIAPSPNALAVQQGPTGYSAAMRANLGLDKPVSGQPAQSGMSALTSQPQWASPVAATPSPTPDPLAQVLGTYQMPAQPVAPPVTPPPANGGNGGNGGKSGGSSGWNPEKSTRQGGLYR